MLWGNPLALLGLAAIAVPLLVHLLVTSRARRVPFPTLRFLPEVVPVAVRARRISDRLLLALRCAIVALAALALAQPWLVWSGRGDDAEPPAPVGVVLDTSDSMERPTPEGEPARAAARRLADGLVADAEHATIFETADLAGGMHAAAAWLATGTPGGGGEIVVVSDFQRGSLHTDAVGNLSDAVGLRLLRIPTRAPGRLEMPELYGADRGWTTTVTAGPATTTATWTAIPGDPTIGASDWLASADDAEAADAVAAAAARVVAVPLPESGRPVTVVWPGAPEREALSEETEAPSAPWMADVLAALPGSSDLRAGSRDGRLYLFADEAPGSLASAQLLASLRRSIVTADPLSELEPGLIDDAVLRGWERPVPPPRDQPGNDGRWLWLAALGLLLVEQFVRRDPAPPVAAASEAPPVAGASGPTPIAGAFESPPVTTGSALPRHRPGGERVD